MSTGIPPLDQRFNGISRTGTVDSVTGDPFVLAPESPIADNARPSNVGLAKQRSQPKDGAILTGKQEHCKKRASIRPS